VRGPKQGGAWWWGLVADPEGRRGKTTNLPIPMSTQQQSKACFEIVKKPARFQRICGSCTVKELTQKQVARALLSRGRTVARTAGKKNRSVVHDVSSYRKKKPGVNVARGDRRGERTPGNGKKESVERQRRKRSKRVRSAKGRKTRARRRKEDKGQGSEGWRILKAGRLERVVVPARSK